MFSYQQLVNEFKFFLKAGASELKISISDGKLDMMAVQAEQLIIWNEKINLTRVKDPLQIAQKHFLDSIAAGLFIKDINSIVDIGSGNGFPIIPIKIYYPFLKVLMIDSRHKKISFLKSVIRTLGIKDIDAIHSRAQDVGCDKIYNKSFDAVISRAFTNLSDLVSIGLPFLNKTGKIYAMKTKKGEKEITDKILKKFDLEIINYNLPCYRSDRLLIVLSQKQ